MISVAATVQHHPSRKHLLPGLLDKLGGLPTEVVVHSSDPPSPWAGYQLCLHASSDSDHLLIIQDDAVPVGGFADVLPTIARDVPVCLYLSHFPRDTKPRAETAMKMNRRYVTLSWRSFLPVVAVLWPREKLIEFREWAKANPKLLGRSEPRSDDAMGGRWKLATRQTVLATVPSIVEHPDREPSLIGRAAMWGKDRGRCAAFLADDARDYDWSLP